MERHLDSLCKVGEADLIQNETLENVTFRFAEEKDAGLVLAFIKELAEYERLAQEVVATEEILVEQLFGSRPRAEVLLAYLDSAPAGFALFFHNFSTFLGKPGIYLEDLFVRPAARGKGIGKALMCKIAAIALERGCGRFEWAVLNWNEPAIDFYRSLGAEPMNEWTVQRVSGDALNRLAAGA